MVEEHRAVDGLIYYRSVECWAVSLMEEATASRVRALTETDGWRDFGLASRSSVWFGVFREILSEAHGDRDGSR